MVIEIIVLVEDDGVMVVSDVLIRVKKFRENDRLVCLGFFRSCGIGLCFEGIGVVLRKNGDDRGEEIDDRVLVLLCCFN